MKIYQHPDVTQLRQFYGDLLYETGKYPKVAGHLSAIADRMWQGLQSGNGVLFKEISNNHPQYLGKTVEELQQHQWTPEDCRTTIACEYGFPDWNAVEQYEAEYDPDFEAAVNHLLEGKYEKLQIQLEQSPDLVDRKSSYGHGATLLHYVASNGVELWRQRVPANLPEMTQLLLKAGARPDTKMKAYGSDYTSGELLETSVHPFKAGVGDQILNLLS